MFSFFSVELGIHDYLLSFTPRNQTIFFISLINQNCTLFFRLLYYAKTRDRSKTNTLLLLQMLLPILDKGRRNIVRKQN